MTLTEFNTLLVREKEPLQRFASGLTRVSADAEDLVQETFVKAIRYRSKFVVDTNLRAWLFTIMKNTFVNEYRRNKKKRELLASQHHALSSQHASVQQQDADSKMKTREILEHVKRLPEEYRQVFAKHYVGFRYEEIARSEAIPLGTVKSRIFMARKALMKSLSPARA